MVQSVELVFDEPADGEIRAQWDLLAEAGLASARRSQPSDHHRPHITLYAAAALSTEADDRLPAIVAGLELEVRIAALMIFGPRRRSCVLVRQVVPSAELLALQSGVARLCAPDVSGPFAPGRWSPHVTLARRLRADQLSAAVQALASRPDELPATITRCRRWDGSGRRAWLLTGQGR